MLPKVLKAIFKNDHNLNLTGKDHLRLLTFARMSKRIEQLTPTKGEIISLHLYLPDLTEFLIVKN